MIDYRFMLTHRRLRERFKMETIERHEARLVAAVAKRIATVRGNA